MFKIGWFSTGGGKASRDLLEIVHRAIKRGKIPDAKISFVFCNRKRGESEETDKFFDLVKELGITQLITLSSAHFESDFFPADWQKKFPEKWRQEYDRLAMSFLAPCEADVVVLAGYMRIVSGKMCKEFRMINLHPAKPGGPKGAWQEVIRHLIEKRERESGVMMHWVTPELDEGPALTFCRYRIKEYDFDKIRRQGLKREFPLIVETLRLLAAGQIKPGDEVRDLTKLINKKIKARR